MKILRILVLTAILLAPAASRAAEHRYDVLSKLLTPFLQVFGKNLKNPNRAVTLSLRLEKMSGLPQALAGTRAELALQAPDQLLVRGPLLGEEITLCRRGQELWAAPGAKLQALLALAAVRKKLPPLDPEVRLEPFALPLPEKQLVFLPAFFQVRDAGVEAIDGEECRVLDLALMPELERSLEERGWAARVWVRADYKPARLVVTRPGWEIAVRFEKVTFSPKLPDSTWQPPDADVLKLDPPHFQQLLRAFTQ